jgi:hypothetical protein
MTSRQSPTMTEPRTMIDPATTAEHTPD